MNSRTMADLTAAQFKFDISLLKLSTHDVNPYFLGYKFDAILILTVAFEKLEKSLLKTNCSTNFSHDSIWRQSCWRIELLNIIKKLDIEGVTGRIRFANGDRIGEIVIEQILGILYIKSIFFSTCFTFKIDFSVS